jgi:biotin carboxyl carrier protein
MTGPATTATIGPASGVRVSLVGGTPDGPEPIVVDRRDGASTIDGSATSLAIEQVDAERAVLRAPSGAEAHRVLLLPVQSATGAIPSGVSRREVVIDGWRIEVDVEPAARAALRDRARRGREVAGRSGPTIVHAIIPGVVVSVSVAPGDAVAAGQQLLVVEAMKMQNELRAPREGTIEQVAVAAGTRIDVGDLLLVIA